MSFPMIDVSSNNPHPINWQKVARSGVKGVMIKCSEGTKYVNPYRAEDANGAREYGLHVGYYHFAQPSINHSFGHSDADEEAVHALESIKGLPRDLGLALDLEVTNGLSWQQLSNWAREFLGMVAAQKITSPLYVSPTFLDNLPGAPFGHKLWLASWGKRPRQQVWAWQYSGTGAQSGIEGQCDLDIYYG